MKRSFLLLNLNALFSFAFASFKAFKIREFLSEYDIIAFPPGINERLDSVTEILTYLRLNMALVPDIHNRKTNKSPKMIADLNNLYGLMTLLFKHLTDDNLKRILMPRVDDQITFTSKLLAKFRIDTNNPWASIVEYKYMTDETREKIEKSSSVDLNTLSQTPASAMIFKNLFKELFEYGVKDGAKPIFVNPDLTSKATILASIMKFMCRTTEAEICRIIHEKTGTLVSSIGEANLRFEVEPKKLFPKDRRVVHSAKPFVHAPFFKFTLRQT